jgi:MFS family permease
MASSTKKPNALEFRRQSSSLHYQTFPNVKPPTSRGRPLSPSRSTSYPAEGQSSTGSPDMSGQQDCAGLPAKQLSILAVVALVEQTALNSIMPYLPEMIAQFPGVDPANIGLHVGVILSAFALAQFATKFFWGWLSDRVGRKPVLLIGTTVSALCFFAFGFCTRMWQAVLVQALLGLGNGNQGLVSTCLGEITNRRTQSRVFTYLPVIIGLGGITGPAVGGLLVMDKIPFSGKPNPYPYAPPNLLSAAILVLDAFLIMIFFEETLDGARNMPPLGERVATFFTWAWQFLAASTKPTYLFRRKHRSRSNGEVRHEEGDDSSPPAILPVIGDSALRKKDVLTRDTILLLTTFLIFQLSNCAYGSLYPIFGEAPPPTGRNLKSREIGLSLSYAGGFTMVFQIFFYGKLRDKLGNRASFRLSHLLLVLALTVMPFVGYMDGAGLGQGKVWMWTELGISLVLRTIATVGGLTSAMLMVNLSAFASWGG